MFSFGVIVYLNGLENEMRWGVDGSFEKYINK